MSESLPPFSLSLFFKRFSLAPLELRSYLIFALVVTAYDYSMVFAPTWLKMAFIPHTGQLVTIGYSFTLFFAVYMIYYKVWKMRWGIVIQLPIISIFGLSKILSQSQISEAYFSAMPYKEASVIQPLWTIIIPIVWVFILHSRQVKTYCGQIQNPRVAT